MPRGGIYEDVSGGSGINRGGNKEGDGEENGRIDEGEGEGGRKASEGKQCFPCGGGFSVRARIP